MTNLLETCRAQCGKLVEQHGLCDTLVTVTAAVLAPAAAIGTPTRRDFPILQGREQMIEAVINGARGQAFTDSPLNFAGTLRDVLALPLTDNGARAVVLAALNALLCHVCLVTDTVHCKDDAPEECATAMAEKARDTGARTVGLIGFNPAIAEALVHVFGAGNVRITDLNPNNIATTKFGVPVHDGHAYGHDLIKGVDLILATGTMVVNGTGEALLQAAQAAGTRCVLYGVTGAAVCHLAGLERWCFQAQSGVSAPQRKTRT